MSRQADETDRPSPGDAPGLEAFNVLLRRTLLLPPKPHSEMKLGKPRRKRLAGGDSKRIRGVNDQAG